MTDEILDLSGGPQCWACRGTGERKKKLKPNQVESIVCNVCHGKKRLNKKKKEIENRQENGRVSIRAPKYADDWVRPGPLVKGGVEPEMGEELCYLVGHWRIFQRIGSHRWSTDDLCTAWYAGKRWKKAHPNVAEPSTYIDLGCGIGSVLLMVAWQFESTLCRGVEAQELSFNMANRSIEYNGCSSRIKIVNADLRTDISEFDVVKELGDGKFDLITGTPPYFPAEFNEEEGVHGATTTLGSIPSCNQSAPARYELRGGVEVYVERASKLLKDSTSRFIVAEGLLHINHTRVLDAAKEFGLIILSQLNVYGRHDKPVLFAVYEMRLKESETELQGNIEIENLIVRYKGGKRSEEYVNMMDSMGIPCPKE